ncbi:YdeI/OmpD-associated family protein [Yoonia sp. F2084L]|uniref:YdeI/OmpD-associated family protein n=1 Tax=Yoonia sp. F2084L TaxID=2926419 RepID=UPI001FF5B959|nr:YdeI/OmpD-associated family protein [Yoonia sp. F2084L]MCK0096440.1 YdeI/OmpD-associated family protein [Yoonia sp. F2084L]
MAKPPLQDAPEVTVETRAALRDWLAQNHNTAGGVWIVAFKKADADRYLPLSEVVDEALCFGWVDSLPRAKDATRTMLYVSPRKPGSKWSRVNKDKVAKLIADGLMTPAGQAVIDKAKADGSWTALDDVEDLMIPADLQAAFDACPGAQTNWEGFPRSVKRGALEIVLNAKRAVTRAAKIATIVEDSAQNKRPFQWKGPKS